MFLELRVKKNGQTTARTQLVEGNLPVQHYRQSTRNLCGPANLRSVLRNDFIIAAHEKDIISLAEILYLGDDNEMTDIRKYGMPDIHWKNVAEYLGINCSCTESAEISDVKDVLNRGWTPIIHRPFSNSDEDGHFMIVMAYFKKEKTFALHDSFLRKKNRDKRTNSGKILYESEEEFMRRWKFKDSPNTGLTYLSADDGWYERNGVIRRELVDKK